MAVENDYDLLVFNLNEFADTIAWLRAEVQTRRLREAEEQLERNQTDWVNLIAVQLTVLDHRFHGLRRGARRVLESEPGKAVFDARPPPET